MTDRSEINPQIRIAEALESIIRILEQMANPPIMCRGNIDGKEFTIAENISFIK